jgi:hypothetical protein
LEPPANGVAPARITEITVIGPRARVALIDADGPLVADLPTESVNGLAVGASIAWNTRQTRVYQEP